MHPSNLTLLKSHAHRPMPKQAKSRLREVEPFLVTRDQTVRQAMERLEMTEEKVVFVVDESSKLVGSLTDGDVRRWILSEGNLQDRVEKVCNPKPFVVTEGFAPEAVRAYMLGHNISCTPVLSPSGQIIRLLFWKSLFQRGDKLRPKQQLDIVVVIMAGGRGTRLEPFTKILPKPLIPLGDRTVIETIIEQFRPYGIDRYYVSVQYKAKIIKSFFEELAPDYTVAYLEEDEPMGTAGSLRSLFSPNPEPILVTNCDILVRADYADLLEFHQHNHYDITLVASLKDYRIPYGVCEIANGGSLVRITEKPAYSLLINTGMYVLQRNRLDLLPVGQSCDMPELLRKVKESGGRVGVYPIAESCWTDTGEWPEYRKALSILNGRS